jgi:hypothetical protein
MALWLQAGAGWAGEPAPPPTQAPALEPWELEAMKRLELLQNLELLERLEVLEDLGVLDGTGGE